MSQTLSRWIGVLRPSPVSKDCWSCAKGNSNPNSWWNPNQAVLQGEGLSRVVGNVDPLGQKRELKEGSVHPKWVFSSLTKTKCHLVGDFLVFVLLFYVSFPYIHLYKGIFTFRSHWDLMLPLGINWSIFPPLCIRGIAVSHILRLPTKVVPI